MCESPITLSRGGVGVRTVATPIQGSEVRVEPADAEITINGVPATLDKVAKADVRVDLQAGATRTFVVEHVLGPLGLRGVTAATVTGIREDWAFERPEHRFCYSTNLQPKHVVGHPAGLPNPGLASALVGIETVETRDATRWTISEPVEFQTDHGRIGLEPREYGAGIRFEVTYGGAEFKATVDPAGQTDEALVETVTTATTPYLSPSDEEAAKHSIADLVSDIAVIGGLDDLVVTAELGEAYHALTIGVVRSAYDAEVVVERSG